jgi:hypothetical protein
MARGSVEEMQVEEDPVSGIQYLFGEDLSANQRTRKQMSNPKGAFQEAAARANFLAANEMTAARLEEELEGISPSGHRGHQGRAKRLKNVQIPLVDVGEPAAKKAKGKKGKSLPRSRVPSLASASLPRFASRKRKMAIASHPVGASSMSVAKSRKSKEVRFSGGGGNVGVNIAMAAAAAYLRSPAKRGEKPLLGKMVRAATYKKTDPRVVMRKQMLNLYREYRIKARALKITANRFRTKKREGPAALRKKLAIAEARNAE